MGDAVSQTVARPPTTSSLQKSRTQLRTPATTARSSESGTDLTNDDLRRGRPGARLDPSERVLTAWKSWCSQRRRMDQAGRPIPSERSAIGTATVDKNDRICLLCQ